MGASSSILKEQDLNEFMKLNPGSEEPLELPVPSRRRSLTDKKGFVIFGILMAVLIPLLIYTLVKSDIRQYNHPWDSCGNFCGVTNKKIKGIECSGRDFSDKPNKIPPKRDGNSTCTDQCPLGYYQGEKNLCLENNTKLTTKDFFLDSLDYWWKFLIVIIITTVLCILTLLLFRYCPGVIVWGVTVLGLLLSVAVTVLFWFLFSQADDFNAGKPGFLGLALVSTIFTVTIIILFFVFRKNIQLIILLYKETAKALFAMPQMMFVPIITLVLQFLVISLMVFTTVVMNTAADLKKNENDKFYSYKMNGAMHFTIGFNVIVTIWALEFFTGCQYMILSGGVAQWFFKKPSTSPISTSFVYTVKYHLGTIALGSFIITLVAVIKALIKSLISNSKFRWLVDCCCGNVEAFLRFLSRNSYIETAIYGQSFFRSGKRAASLIITNASSVIAVNSVGDFILRMTQFILLVVSTAIAYGIFMKTDEAWYPVAVSFVLNLIIIAVVFCVFETIVDTLLVCFCEDAVLNDGTTRPYNMSTGYMQFVEETKKVYKK